MDLLHTVRGYTLGLSLALTSLGGCATPMDPLNPLLVNTPALIRYQPRTDAIRVNRQNVTETGIVMDAYEKIAPADIEKQLVFLAQREHFEDAWAYSQKRNTLYEIGIEETPFETKKSVFPLSAFAQGDHVILYHHHPLMTAAWALPRAFPDAKPKELEAKLNDPSFIYSLPSSGDIDYLARKNLFLGTRGITAETRIADHRNITTMTLLTDWQAKMALNENWREEIGRTTKDYLESKIPFERLLSFYRTIGVALESRKIEDVEVKALRLDSEDQKLAILHKNSAQ